MNMAGDLERSIRQFQVTTSMETDRRILDDAFAALEESMPEVSAGRRRSIQRIVTLPTVMKLAAAAAVVVAACTFLFKALSPKTIELPQIYQALQKAENLCVSTYTDAEGEPVQQVWASRTLNIVMSKSRAGGQVKFDLFDIPNRLKKTRYLASDTVGTERLAPEQAIRIERSISDIFELLPFAETDPARDGTQWSKVPDEDREASVPGTQLYDLTWPVEGSSYKCRIYVDAKSDLPRRIAYYFKENQQGQYKFESIQVPEYPSEKEIKLLIREIFGPDQTRSGEPGYIGTPGHRAQDTAEKE